MVFNLSRCLTNRAEIRLLAMNGLGIKKHIVEKHFHDETDITEAAYRILDEWCKNQRSPRNAYDRLCKTLKEVNMSSYIECIQMGTMKNTGMKNSKKGSTDCNDTSCEQSKSKFQDYQDIGSHPIEWFPFFWKYSNMIGIFFAG